MSAESSLLDPNARLRMPELRKYIPLSEQRIRQLVAMGKLAPPERIGMRAVAWKVGDVQAFLARLAREDAERRAGLLRKRGPAPKSLSVRRAASAQ